MKSLPWFRMYHEFATDPKVQMMNEAYQRRYIMLLCLRCRNGDVTLQETEVAFQLRITDDEWAATKREFVSRGLINKDNKPTAWDTRQMLSDSSAARVAKWRDKMKQSGNVTETATKRRKITDTDKDTDNKNISTDSVARFHAVQYLIQQGADEKIAKDWVQHRKSMKAPASQTAIDGIIREARKARWHLNEVLSECCTRGWRSFKAEWTKDKQPQMTAHQASVRAAGLAIFGNLEEQYGTERVVNAEAQTTRLLGTENL